MIWGYLQEFWNAITGVGEYTIAFFQNIGNAVAGAVGNLFSTLIHHITDVFIFLGWLVNSLGTFFSLITAPVRFVFGFFKTFIDSAFATPVDNTIWVFNAEIMSIFETIPYWSILTAILGACLLFLIGVAILKQFSRL